MHKVIPILPCPNVREQATFYEHMGFEITALYTSPNPYVTLRYGEIELHFWGSRRNVPAENSSMCYVQVNDVDAVCEAFTAGLKQGTGKIPRAGIPRITKVRDLKDDRRFTLTDTGGNTFYIGTPMTQGEAGFFRELEGEEHRENFKVLYDLIYSKEDAATAAKMLPRLTAVKASLSDLDRARLLLVERDIQRELGEAENSAELDALVAAHTGEQAWERMKARVSLEIS